MRVCIDFDFTIKAKTKQDYDFIKSIFKSGNFEDINYVPRYMKKMIKGCKYKDKKFEITFMDEDSYAHPKAKDFYLEILKYLARKNKSISFKSMAVEYCEIEANCHLNYICKNGELKLLHFNPLQLFIDEKCRCSGCVFEGVGYYEYEEGLLELEDSWGEWFLEHDSSSYQKGMYFLDEEELFDNVDEMKKSLISAYERLVEKKEEAQVYAIFINNGEKKGFHFTFDGEKIQEVELKIDKKIKGSETIDALEIKTFDESCDFVRTNEFGMDLDDYDEDDYDEDEE